MMFWIMDAKQSVFYSIFSFFSLFVSINCQIFNLSNVDERVNDVNEIIKELREFESENIVELMNSVRQIDIYDGGVSTINFECNNQINNYYSGIRNMETWALKMLDASSKIPSGIMEGNLKDIGMFDECVSVKATKQNMTILGRHCLYTLSANISESQIKMQATLSICLPAACNTEEVNYLLKSVINMTKRYMNDSDLTVISSTCSNIDNEPLDLATIITVIAFGLLICFLIFCTIADGVMSLNTFSTTNNSSFLHALCKFSLYKNAKRILSTDVPRDSLPAISGIRFFSMSWVIFGHTYFQNISGVLINQADLIPWTFSWSSLGILIAPFAVDTFFVLSGFLTSYLFLREMKTHRRFNLIKYYIHRYIRLTPALGALLLITIFIAPRLGSGALWQANMGMQKNFCSKHWWNLLLYIQNYRNIEVMACLGHTWYLAVDMQLFWISPLILYPLAKKPRIGLFIFIIFVITSIITPTVIALENKYSGGLFTVKSLIHVVNMMSNYYIRTYTRAVPWLMGVFIGYKLNSTTNSPGIKFIQFGWILSLLSFAFIIFTYRIYQNENYEFNMYWEGFYAAFSRCIWSYGICWIVYASALGYGGFISNFLSSAVFLPFGRISYSVYLVHFLIQFMKVSATRTPEYFSNIQMIHVFLSDIVTCIVAGFIFSLLFESPFLVLEKILLVKTRKIRSKKVKDDLRSHENTNGNDNYAYRPDNIQPNV